MAIFIVDQFSLNTDLPLDIRYVPSGGTYNDVSMYWYPGMQVYQTLDQKIWYADNSLNWHALGEGSDASINTLYQFVIDLSLYINDLTSLVQIHEVSIGDLTVRVISLETSVGYLQTWNAAQDSSIVNLRTQINLHETSLGNLTNWNQLQDISINFLDSSIKQLFGKISNNDVSIQDLWNWQISQDASITNLRGRIDAVDGSITYLTDWNIDQDTSITNLDSLTQLHEASLGNLDQWQISQDLSIANLDASLDLYLPLTGGTITGDLTIDGSTIFNGKAIFKGDAYFEGLAYFVDVETIDISSAFIHLNTGLTGAPPANLQSGIIVGRGTSDPYVFIYDETSQTFRIGIAQETSTGYLDSSTQAVASRQDTPISGGVAYWNSALFRMDTSAGFTFTSGGLLLDTSLQLLSYAGASDLMLIVGTDGYVRTLSTPEASLNIIFGRLSVIDSSITYLTTWNLNQDTSISALDLLAQLHEASLGNLTLWNLNQDTSISALDLLTQLHEASLGRLDASINKLFELTTDTSVLGAINIGDGSAAVYAGITNDGSLQFREFVGVGAATVTENGNLIEIGFDASFAGEINTASNIPGGDASIFSQKVAQDLVFKSIKAVDSNELIITSDASYVYFDVSIAAISDASLSGLSDVSINESTKVTHQIIEWDSSIIKWTNTNGILWDTSLGTTADGFNSIPPGTNLEGFTLKEILFKLLYEYQVPVLYVGSDPVDGIYEKGLTTTQFSSIDVSYYALNSNYPLAKLNNIQITKTGTGTLLDSSLGLVDSSQGTYTDVAGITNWGGTNRTINYNVYIWDNQLGQTQPAVYDQASFTFYYRQHWGVVDGNTNFGQVDSSVIKNLSDSRLAGETDLNATFVNPGSGFIKYLFAYPDTVASPDNFGLLSQIIDQNSFDITDSFQTGNVDVSVDTGNVRYRAYLLKNKVDTSTFDITFKF